MSFKEIFIHAVKKAQQPEFCHKKLMKLVENAFDKSKLEELLKLFTDALFGCYLSDNCADKNSYCARGLEFLARIAIKITLECVQPIEITDANGTASQVYDITLDPFFTNVLKSSLKFTNVDKTEVRFNTCFFIMSLLQNIGNNVEMDYSICNTILESLVPLLHDPKPNVRIQAIKALLRLQEPSNADCLVLKSFWILSTDPNSEVRKAIISHIAAHPQSYSKIRMRITDTDLSVRQAAYKKFADINPKLFLKIIDRNIILTNGLADQNKKIQQIMSEILLPKWLNSFEGNYLLFFRALRLDADENDINNFEMLLTQILNIFLKKNSLADIVKYLPVNKEDKLIPIQRLCLESVFYWINLIEYLRNVEDGEEYLSSILPELTAFSNYIERIIKEKSSVTMDEWENLEYQNILLQLFKISSGFDMSDEVGRKTFYALILKILTTHKFHQKVIDMMLQVASQLNSDVGSLTIDLCQVISEIREPLIDETPSEDKLRKQNFEITQLKVKIHQLEINEEEASKKKDFQHAHIVQNEIVECQRELAKLKNLYSVTEKVRVSKDDLETLCRCLDILIGLLKIPKITTMYPALQSCRDEFLMPLLNNNTSDVHWRFILCLGLFSLMDKDLAFKHANFLCLPIATYRVVPNYDKLALKTSVACVTDVIRVFGVKVIGMEDNSQSELNQESNPTTSRRKLYSEDLSQPEVLNKDDITLEFIIDIIVDMLDDEDEGVRQTASTSICRLIVHNFPVSPELICRLILKWYNPETEKKDRKLHLQLGSIIECFANKTKGAREVVQKSVVPIIASIVNASGTSPLLEIDIENVLRFLAALTNDDTGNIHDEIAINLIERMSNKPNDACTPYFIKLLTYLELSFKNLDVYRNLISSTEMLAADIVDKIPKKNLIKFRNKSMAGFKEASIASLGDNSESLVTTGIEGDQSSLIRNSLANAESNSQNAGVPGDINQSAKDSEDNGKGNSSNSESDSGDDFVHTNPNTTGSNNVKFLGKRSLLKSVKQASKVKTKLRKISEEPVVVNEEKNKKSITSEKTPVIRKGEFELISNKKSSTVNEQIERKNGDLVCVKYDYTPEKNAEKLKNSKKNNSEKTNIEIISQVVLQEPKKNLEKDEISEKTSRSTRSSKMETEMMTDRFPKRNRKKQQKSNSERIPSSSIADEIPPQKQSSRKTVVPSKFKDYVSSNVAALRSKASPKQKQAEKRTAKTPLSAIVNRKSKRFTKRTTENPPSTPNKVISAEVHSVQTPSRIVNNYTPLLTVGRRLSRRLSLSVTRNSNKKTKKSRPSVVVGLLKNLRNTPRNSKIYPKRHPNTPNSSLRSRSNGIQKTKEPQEKKSSTNTECSKLDNKNRKKNNVQPVTKRTSSRSRNENLSKKRSVSAGPHILQKKESSKELNKDDDETSDNESSEQFNRSADNCNASRRNNNKKSVGNEVNNKMNKKNSEIDEVESEKNNAQKARVKLKATNSQQGKRNEIIGNSNSEEDEHNSTSNSKSGFKRSRRKVGKEIPKYKPKINKNSKLGSNHKTDGVLQSLNSVMNEIKNTSINRKSSRIADKNINKSASIDTSSTKRQNNEEIQQESTRSPTLTRSRISNRLNESNSSSRKRLEFSSFSDETILKTFLQGDEEFQVLENMSIGDVNSLSDTSHDSKKENLSINSVATSNTFRRSSRRKRNSSNSPESLPRKKMMKTKYKRNLQRVKK